MKRCHFLGWVCLVVFGVGAVDHRFCQEAAGQAKDEKKKDGDAEKKDAPKTATPEELAKLIKQLSSRSEADRAAAASDLAELGPGAKDAVDKLASLARSDSSKEVKRQAVKALGAIGPDAKKAVATLVNLVAKDTDNRDVAAEALVKIGGESAADGLAKMLNAQVYKQPVVRQTAAGALGELAPKLKAGPAKNAVIRALRNLLNRDPDKKTQALAMEALGKMGADSKEAVPELIKLFDHKDKPMRQAAIAAVCQIAAQLKGGLNTSLLKAIRERLIQETDVKVKKATVEAIGNMGPEAKELVTSLLGLFEDKDQGVKLAAIAAVGKIGTDNKAALKAYGNLLNDGNKNIRDQAIVALLKMGGAGAAMVAEILKGNDVFKRIAVLDAIAKSSDPVPKEMVPYLLTGLSDPNAQIKKQSEALLAKLGKDAGVILAASLKDKDEKVRLAAAKVLQKSGVDNKAAVPDLAAGLKDPNEEIRTICAEALAKLGQDAEGATAEVLDALKVEKSEEVRKNLGQVMKNIGRKALPKLVGLLADKDATTRAAAATALGEMGKIAQSVIQKLIELKKDPDQKVREAAQAALGKISQESPFAMEELLKSPDVETRRQGAQALAESGPAAKQVLPTLLAALANDKDAEVRKNCAAALKGLANAENAKDLVEKLIAALKDPDKDVRAQACLTLGEFEKKAEPAIPHLKAAFADPSDVVPKAAAEALGKIGLAAIPALATALEDPKPIVRRSAAVAIKDISTNAGEKDKPKAAVLALIKVLRDADLETRQCATQALAEIGADAKPAEIDLIFAMLRDKDSDVRKSASLALLKTQPAIQLAVPAFIQALRDKIANVTDVAVDALGKVAPQAVPALVEALKDKDPQVRRLCCDILAKAGPPAKPAIPALKGLSAGDADPRVKNAADKAIKAIEG